MSKLRVGKVIFKINEKLTFIIWKIYYEKVKFQTYFVKVSLLKKFMVSWTVFCNRKSAYVSWKSRIFLCHKLKRAWRNVSLRTIEITISIYISWMLEKGRCIVIFQTHPCLVDEKLDLTFYCSFFASLNQIKSSLISFTGYVASLNSLNSPGISFESWKFYLLRKNLF